MSESVVITGMGIVSALGTSLPSVLAHIDNDHRGLDVREVAGRKVLHAPVSDYDPGNYIARKKIRRMDAANTYAIAAAKMALGHAGIEPHGEFAHNFGVIVGTGYSGFSSVVEHQRAYLRDGLKQLTPIHFPNTVYNASAGMVAIELGLNGPNSTVIGLDVCGEYALTYAWMLLQQGLAERIAVIGVDDLCETLLEGFHDLGFAARHCDTPPQPLGRAGGGFIPSEGAGALVLETQQAAQKRGAQILGQIDGIGIYSSASKIFSYSENGEAITYSIQAALQQAGCSLDDINWVSSAANGTLALDSVEATSLGATLQPGQHAIVPFKRFIGEFSSSGILRIALGLGCLQRGYLPNALGQDPLDSLLPYRTREGSPAGKRFLHHGFGLGGNSVAIVLSSSGASYAH